MTTNRLPFLIRFHDLYYHRNMVGNPCTRMGDGVYIGRTSEEIAASLYLPCSECVGEGSGSCRMTEGRLCQ